MKIALSTFGNDLDSALDQRFGRAKKFLIYDLATDHYEIFDNVQNFNLSQGAGIQTASNIANKGVTAVITGHVGPKAFQTLHAAKIKLYLKNSGSIKEAITDYKNNRLEPASGPDKEGHWE